MSLEGPHLRTFYLKLDLRTYRMSTGLVLQYECKSCDYYLLAEQTLENHLYFYLTLKLYIGWDGNQYDQHQTSTNRYSNILLRQLKFIILSLFPCLWSYSNISFFEDFCDDQTRKCTQYI